MSPPSITQFMSKGVNIPLWKDIVRFDESKSCKAKAIWLEICRHDYQVFLREFLRHSDNVISHQPHTYNFKPYDVKGTKLRSDFGTLPTKWKSTCVNLKRNHRVRATTRMRNLPSKSLMLLAWSFRQLCRTSKTFPKRIYSNTWLLCQCRYYEIPSDWSFTVTTDWYNSILLEVRREMRSCLPQMFVPVNQQDTCYICAAKYAQPRIPIRSCWAKMLK